MWRSVGHTLPQQDGEIAAERERAEQRRESQGGQEAAGARQRRAGGAAAPASRGRRALTGRLPRPAACRKSPPAGTFLDSGGRPCKSAGSPQNRRRQHTVMSFLCPGVLSVTGTMFWPRSSRTCRSGPRGAGSDCCRREFPRRRCAAARARAIRPARSSAAGQPQASWRGTAAIRPCSARVGTHDPGHSPMGGRRRRGLSTPAAGRCALL